MGKKQKQWVVRSLHEILLGRKVRQQKWRGRRAKHLLLREIELSHLAMTHLAFHALAASTLMGLGTMIVRTARTR